MHVQLKYQIIFVIEWRTNDGRVCDVGSKTSCLGMAGAIRDATSLDPQLFLPHVLDSHDTSSILYRHSSPYVGSMEKVDGNMLKGAPLYVRPCAIKTASNIPQRRRATHSRSQSLCVQPATLV